MDVITLRADGFGLRLAPEAGGMVTRYWLERGDSVWEWLRPASDVAVSRRDAAMVLWPDYVMRKPWCYFARRTNLSCWRTPSGIWAMSILSRDAQIWRSLVTTRHLDFIGDMKPIRR